MKNIKKTLSIIIILVVVISIGFLYQKPLSAIANQSVFNVLPTLFVGTTSPAFIDSVVGGTATSTTVVLDSYAAGTGRAIDSATLLLDVTALGLPPTIKWRYEYSQGNVGNIDCIIAQNNCDWYSADIELTTNATTTIHSRTFAEHSWAFASTTGGSFSNSRATKLLTVPTPTRYVRAVFYTDTGLPNYTIFHRWVSKNQI